MATLSINFDSGYSTGALNGQNGWTTSSAGITVGTTHYSSPYGLNHNGASSWNSADRLMDSGNPITLSFRMRFSALHSDPFRSGNIYIREDGSSPVAFQIGGYTNTQGGITNGTTPQSLGAITTGTWYLFEFESRSSDNYARGRMNGGSWSSWIAPGTSYTTLGAIGANTLNSAFQIDDIVWTYPDPTPSPSVNDTITVTDVPTLSITTGTHNLSVFDAITVADGPSTASQGPNNAGTGTNDAAVGTVAWSNPGNITSSNNSYATAFFAMAVDGKDTEVKIVKADGSIGTENKANTVDVWPQTDAYAVYGGSTDDWGETWTAEDINNSNFGVVLAAINDSTTTNYLKATNFGFTIPENSSIDGIIVEIERHREIGPPDLLLMVDHVRITVHYTSAIGLNIEVSSNLSISDTVTITDVPTIQLTSYNLSVSDTITVTDVPSLVKGGDRYWVGGSADWNSTAGSKWSETSGGTGGASVPTALDNVFFDANSGAVTVSVGVSVSYTAICRDLNCNGFTGTLTVQSYQGPSSNGNLDIYGSLYLSAGMTVTSEIMGNNLTFKATSTGHTITANGHAVKGSSSSDTTTAFNGVGGGWTFQDNIAINPVLSNGSINTNGVTVTCDESFQTTGSGTKTLTFGSSTILMTSNHASSNGFSMGGTNLTLNAGTSTIRYTNTSSSIVRFSGGGYTYNNVWFDRGVSTGNIVINGSNTFNTFTDSGTAAHKIGFVNGTTQTFSDFDVSGNPGALITINSTNSSGTNQTTTHALIKAGGGIVESDYLNIQHSIATPGTVTWYAGNNSVDNQAVSTAGSGWIFTASGPAPSVNDAITVTDVPTLQINTSVSVNDAITVTDVPTFSINTQFSVNDAVTVTDVPTIRTSAILLSVFDAITVADVVSGLTVGERSISVNDTITVTDVPTLMLDKYLVNVSDTITVTDVPTLMLDRYLLNVYDIITVTDVPTLIIANRTISTNDTVIVTDAPTLIIANRTVNVNDAITVTDLPALQIVTSVNVNDSITVTDIPVLTSTYPINVNDSITVSESVTVRVNSNLSVYDSVTVSDVPTAIVIISLLHVNENITVSDVPDLVIAELLLSVNDSLTVTESITIETVYNTTIYDSVSVSENVALEIITIGYSMPSSRPRGSITNISPMGSTYQNTGYQTGGSGF